MTVGYPDWSGTRLLHGTEQVYNNTIGPLAQGQSQTVTIPITRPGYIIEIHAWNATDNVTSLPYGIGMRWRDAQSGDGIDSQLWYAFAGNAVSPHYLDGSGPTKGGLLDITIENNASAAVNLEVFIIFDQTSFAYVRHDWRTDDVFSFVIPGHNVPTFFDANAGLLGGFVGFTLLANQTDHFAIPLYNGPIQMHCDTSGAASSTEVFLQMGAAGGTEAGVVVWDEIVPTTGLDTLFYAPRCQLTLGLQNHTASSIQVDVSLFMGER